MRRFMAKGYRLRVIGFVLFVLSPFAFMMAQSNLTYELKVGATGDVQVLKTFPESYAGEKVNIRIQTASLKVESQKMKDKKFTIL